MNAYIDALLQYGLDKHLILKDDLVYVRNRLLDVLGLQEYVPSDHVERYEEIAPLLDNILNQLVQEGKLTDSINSRDLMDTRIMDCLTPMPSMVIQRFHEDYNISPQTATDHYYELAKNTNYIRNDRIQKDRKWTIDTEYGTLDITINLSKPEKDPKDIAAAKLLPPSIYPKCLLCKENEGYAGTIKHPARNNHRIIPMTLNQKQYYMQYSPYVYYPEHCIVLNAEHVPMAVNRDAFSALLDFLDVLPHYFLGSNADLPIVGGSILSHDHFQGGHYEFAMERAEMIEELHNNKYEGLVYGRVHWPMSTIRIRSKKKEDVLSFACRVHEAWMHYSDEALSIKAYTKDIRHHTITPIARRKNGCYEMDLVLRDNQTSKEYPEGIFHPHRHLHHIKKENIGLIEVMGLAVLPARLLNEMDLLKKAWLQDIDLQDNMLVHEPWLKQLKRAYPNVQEDRIDAIIEQEIGEVFLEVLCDAGVYKQDEAGQKGFLSFMKHMMGE